MVESEPMAICLEAQFEHPLGLLLLLRDKANDALVQTLGDELGLDIGAKAILVVGLLDCGLNIYILLFHFCQKLCIKDTIVQI